MLSESEARCPANVEFELKLDDLIAYFLHPNSSMSEEVRAHIRLAPWIITAMFMGLGTAFGGFLILRGRINLAEWGLVVLFSMVMGVLGTCTMHSKKGKAKLAAVYAKKETPLGHWNLQLTEEGLIGQTSKAGVQCWWANAEHVIVTDSHILVGPYPVVVIPRRAFTHEGEYRRFVATCRQRVERERGKSAEALNESDPRGESGDQSAKFKFSYDVTPELMKQAMKQLNLRQYSTGGMLGCLLFLLGVGIIGAVIVILAGPSWHGILMIVVPLTVFGLAYLGILASYRQAANAARATANPIAEMSVDGDGIRWKGSDGETELKWSAMKSLWKGPDVWLIFIGSQNIYRIVPAELITDDAKEFIEERIRWAGGTIA